MSKTDTKPHRRLSLTLPTQASRSTEAPHEIALVSPESQETSRVAPEPNVLDPLPSEAANEHSQSPVELSVVRVMAYLTPDEARLLDELWFEMRRNKSRASKSDILRAALDVANRHQSELTTAIAKQQVSTQSRQRTRKTAS